MACHEADEKFAGNVVYHADEVCKIDVRAEIFSVGVYVLAKERYVLAAALYKLPCLGDDILGPARALPSADIGHDAVGAEIIAAVHDRKPGLYAAVAL